MSLTQNSNEMVRSALKASIKTIFKHFNPKAQIPFGARVQVALSSEGRGVGFCAAHTARGPTNPGQSSASLPSARPPCSPKPPNPGCRLASQQGSFKRICGKPTKDLLSVKCFCEVWKASELNEEHQVRATASLQSPHSLCRGFPCTPEPGEQHISQ